MDVGQAARVAPDRAPGARVERRGVVHRAGDEHNAVDDDRRVLDVGAGELKRPLAPQTFHVFSGDGFEAAVMRALVVAPVREPVLRLFPRVADALERDVEIGAGRPRTRSDFRGLSFL